MCSISFLEYLEQSKLKEKYDTLSSEEKDKINLYSLLILYEPAALFGLIQFFIQDKVIFDGADLSFHVYKEEAENGETKKTEIGKIDKDNFDLLRNEILKCLGLKQIETKKPKYKTERARILAEKIEKAKAQLNKTSKQDGNMALDNMIKKYCTHNKVGINILNVWDMTFYQFNVMFSEYNVGRQMDFNDIMAANTFQFKEVKDYKPALWMEKINNSFN